MISWSVRRQLTYFFVFLAVLIAAAAFIVASLWPQPTCDDGRRNQDELGVDCGGVCTRVCGNESLSVRSIWTRILPLGDGTYDLASMIVNPNSDLRALNISYEIKFVDQAGALINSVKGDVSLAPGESFPVFHSAIKVGRRIPARAYLEIVGAPRWERASSINRFNVTNDVFKNEPTPLLEAKLSNLSDGTLSGVTVAAVLSDSDHNAFAVSTTFVPTLSLGEAEAISFTWPIKFSSPPAFIEFYPHAGNQTTN